MNQTTYPIYFADTRRSSSVAVVSHSKGELLWIKPLSIPQDRIPRFLFIWEGHIVVETLTSVHVFAAEGKQLWELEKVYGGPIAIANDLLYRQYIHYRLSAVNLRGELVLNELVLEDAMDRNFPVSLLAPRKEDFLAVIQSTGRPQRHPPEVYVEATPYSDDFPNWYHKFEGLQSILPLYISETEHLIVFLKDIMIFDSKTGTEIGKLKFPIETPYTCSADADGNLYFTGSGAGKTSLVSLAIDGKENWRWSDPIIDRKWSDKQPPIIGADGKIYIITDTSVLLINKGSFVWEFTEKEKIFNYGTALADGTLLITAGNTLYRLDNEGKRMFAVNFENEIITPPVADAEGNIYVATPKELAKIE